MKKGLIMLAIGLALCGSVLLIPTGPDLFLDLDHMTPEQLRAAIARDAALHGPPKPKVVPRNQAAIDGTIAVLKYETMLMETHQGGFK
jgi:threonine aldolase